jgi:DNA polymerase-4
MLGFPGEFARRFPAGGPLANPISTTLGPLASPCRPSRANSLPVPPSPSHPLVPRTDPAPDLPLSGRPPGSGFSDAGDPALSPPPRARGQRRILHLDVDAFLASVEQAVHPELKGKPLVIGGLPGERNLVMSSSYEARAFGVRPGMPLAEAARRCPRAIFRRGDSQAANRLRERTAHLLGRYSPLVEVASIDDFFVDLTACARLFPRAFDAAVNLRAEIRREVDLPVTIGVGTNRMLARLARASSPSRAASPRSFPAPSRPSWLPCPWTACPASAHSIGADLERFGIRTVADLRQVSREVLFASFGSLGLVLWERARGQDDEPGGADLRPASRRLLRDAHSPPPCAADSTFEPEEGRREHIEAMLAYIVERAAHRLRSPGRDRALPGGARALRGHAAGAGAAPGRRRRRLRVAWKTRHPGRAHRRHRRAAHGGARAVRRPAAPPRAGEAGGHHPARAHGPGPAVRDGSSAIPPRTPPPAPATRIANGPWTAPSTACAPSTASAACCAARACRSPPRPCENPRRFRAAHALVEPVKALRTGTPLLGTRAQSQGRPRQTMLGATAEKAGHRRRPGQRRRGAGGCDGDSWSETESWARSERDNAARRAAGAPRRSPWGMALCAHASAQGALRLVSRASTG